MTTRVSSFLAAAARRIGRAWIADSGADSIIKADGDDQDHPTDDQDLEREILAFGASLTPLQRDTVRAMYLLAAANMRWQTLPPKVQGYYSRSASNGSDIGLDQIEANPPAEDIPERAELQTASDQEIADFVARRTAELVGMKRLEDGSLIENPDARWAITDATREDLVRTVCQAVEEGWTSSQLAAVIEGSYTFSAARSAVIARTELARAQAFGNYIAWHLTGASIFVQWMTSEDEGVCDECEDLEDQGVVPLGHEFEPFVEFPPAHPNCRCSLEVVPQPDVDSQG